jgi:hypothetical protein
MSQVNTDSAWSRGRLWSAARIGAPTGVMFGGLQYASGGSVGGAIAGGLFFGVIIGPLTALRMWRHWPGARDLNRSGRLTVVRLVRRGGSVDDPKLAPGVLDYAAYVRRTQDREKRFSWVLWIFAGLTLALALDRTLNGSDRKAAVLWVLVVFWAAILAWYPRKRGRVLSHASEAEAAARRLLGGSSETR